MHNWSFGGFFTAVSHNMHKNLVTTCAKSKVVNMYFVVLVVLLTSRRPRVSSWFDKI